MTDNIPSKIIIDDKKYKPAKKLEGKVAIITGGDSGIGAATAIAFAKEGADVVISYLSEDKDAQNVAKIVKSYGQEAVHCKGDLGEKVNCDELIALTLEKLGKIDILVNNAGTQVVQESIVDITEEQLLRTFKTNIFSMFYLTQKALQNMNPNACIINTTSVTAYRGSEELLDYSATKGAITTFTRSLSQNLAGKSVRVNAVAPGPVWTPLVLSSFDSKKLSELGKNQPLGRAAQPVEIAPAYVFLASDDSRYITGQVIHVNGGEIING